MRDIAARLLAHLSSIRFARGLLIAIGSVALAGLGLTDLYHNPQAVSEFVSRIRLIPACAAYDRADCGAAGREAGLNTLASVRVNHPITYRGFRIYQLGYNPDDPTWSALLLVKDPGVPAIYSGFGMIVLGVVTVACYLSALMAYLMAFVRKRHAMGLIGYAVYLHHRLAMKWPPEQLAWFLVCAFPLVLFTYLGVNYLLVGLHSYAG